MSPTTSTALLLDLSLPAETTSPIQTPSNPQRSLTPSGGLSCTLQPSSAANRPRLSLRFPSPMPESLGMRTAREWHREQLLQARLRMEQRNALCLKRGQIPTTLTTSLTCDHAREDADLSIIATDIPLPRDPPTIPSARTHSTPATTPIRVYASSDPTGSTTYPARSRPGNFSPHA